MGKLVAMMSLGVALAATGCEHHEMDELFDLGIDADAIERIDANVDSANVLLEAGADDQATVDFDIGYWGKRKPRYDVWVESGALRVTLDCWLGCDGTIAIKVPRDVAADLDTGSGNIRVVGITGDVWADTGSGDIKGSDLEGLRVTAETGSGNVNLELTDEPESICVKTGSGNVRITVPREGRYNLHLGSGSGDKDVDNITVDSSSPQRITAHTGSGDITVKGR